MEHDAFSSMLKRNCRLSLRRTKLKSYYAGGFKTSENIACSITYLIEHIRFVRSLNADLLLDFHGLIEIVIEHQIFAKTLRLIFHPPVITANGFVSTNVDCV